jgi:tetratricopeptide (TPR) repeat protein
MAQWREGRVSDVTNAKARLIASVDRVRAAQSPALLGETLYALGRVHGDLNESDAAAAALDEMTALAKAADDASSESLAVGRLSEVRMSTGGPKQAAPIAQSAREIAPRAGDPFAEANALTGLAMATSIGGRIDEALGLFDRADALAERAGARRLLAQSLNNRATTLAQVIRSTTSE